MILFLLVPFALLFYFLVVRFLFRKWRYRWAVWLWGLAYWGQLPFFYGRESGWKIAGFALDPLRAWADDWDNAPGTALLLLLVPSVPACLAFWVQHRRDTRPPAPPSPPRPWVVPTLFVGFFGFLLALLWWLHNG